MFFKAFSHGFAITLLGSFLLRNDVIGVGDNFKILVTVTVISIPQAPNSITNISKVSPTLL